MKNEHVILLIFLLILPIQFLNASAPRTLVVHRGSACVTGDLYFNLPSEALSQAAPGDTVLICPGTYEDNVKVSVNGIRIRGHGDPSEVRIEALNNTQNVIELRNVRNVTIENLTVVGAIGSQMAGIHVQLSSESVIKNVIAVGNYFGINIVSSSNITLASARAENNTNAGIYLKGAMISSLSNSLSRGNGVGIQLLFTSETSIDGINTTGNAEGGILLEYSSNNTISNSFSGFNGWYGIYLENSDGNSLSNLTVINNTALGSDGYGIYAYLKSENNSFYGINVRDNVYGVAFVSGSDGNVLNDSLVYNNTVAGVYIESSSGNDGEANISSSMYGIWIQDGSNNTVKGGEISGCRWGILIAGLRGSSGNVINGTRIHDNSYIGIVVDGNSSRENVITRLSSYNNTMLGIDLGGDFVTPNDGSVAEGPNDLIDYPVFSWAAVYGSKLIVKGYINREGEGSANPNFNGAKVEIYQSDGDPSGYGEGLRYLGALTARNGQFTGWIDLPNDLAGKPINLTGTSTLLPHGTSEFGPAYLAPVVSTNLTISKSVNPPIVTPNSTAEVLLLVRNYGNGTAYNVTVTDVLPEGMGYVNGTSRVNGDLIEPEIDGRNLSWHINVPADSEVRIRFNVSINAPSGKTLENLAIFYGDYGSGNDTSYVKVIEPAVIEATKEANPDVVNVNQTVNYTIKLDNSGGMGALLMVEDALPSGMTYVNGSFRSNVTVEGPLIRGNRMRYNLSLGPGKAALVKYSLKATSYGTKENKVYVNGSFIASSSILVRNPPPSDGGNKGSGGRSSRGSSGGGWSSLPPPCGWIPPTGGERRSTNSSNSSIEEAHNYTLMGNPIVLVSLGSQGVKVSRGSSMSSTGSSTGGNSGVVVSKSKAGTTGMPLLVVEIMATPTSAETGTPITFVVRTSNIGDGLAENITLLVDLTRGLDYVKGSSMVGGLHREPDNENNRLIWKIGHLSQGMAVEVSFRAELLATSGSFNVMAKAGSSSDSVLISVKPKQKPKPPKKPAPAPEVVDLRASSTSLKSTSRVVVTLTSPTGAKHVKVMANLDPSLRYVQGSSRVNEILSSPGVRGNALDWQVSIGKGKSAIITFEVSPANESNGGKVLISLPKYGKRAEVEVRFSPAERAMAPPPSFRIELPSLPPIPWWLLLIPLMILPFLLAVRRREEVKRIVMDYEALKWATMRGMLEDLIQEQEILISKETFSKLSKDRGLMPLVDGLVVEGKIRVKKAPRRKIFVEGADEELSAALGLADREKLPIYVSREDLLKELKRRGFDARLVREAPPPILKNDLP